MRNALKVAENPTITFTPDELRRRQERRRRRRHDQRHARPGRSEEAHRLPGDGRARGRNAPRDGVYELRMTDYGLKPPSLMFGRIKVGETVKVKLRPAAQELKQLSLLSIEDPTMTTTRFLLVAAALAAATPASRAASHDGHRRDHRHRRPRRTTARRRRPTPSPPRRRLSAGCRATSPPPSRSSTCAPPDQRGLNVFESPKEAGAAYTGFKLAWGGAFTQQFQNLTHRTRPRRSRQGCDGKDVNQNALIPIGSGFNNADANLYLNAQLARGIRVAVESYASARHHQETLGQGRLLPDRRLADRERAARQDHGVHDAQGRTLRGQLRRRSTSAAATTADALQPVRRQLHHRRLHDRDRRRGVPPQWRLHGAWAA